MQHHCHFAADQQACGQLHAVMGSQAHAHLHNIHHLIILIRACASSTSGRPGTQ
jgi:hypothetical protein